MGLRPPPGIELADRLADFTPGDLTACSSPPEAARPSNPAWKLARQYFKVTGEPPRYKVISRNIAYHGTTLGALSINGIPSIRQPSSPSCRAPEGAEHEPVPVPGLRPLERLRLRVRGRIEGQIE